MRAADFSTYSDDAETVLLLPVFAAEEGLSVPRAFVVSGESIDEAVDQFPTFARVKWKLLLDGGHSEYGSSPPSLELVYVFGSNGRINRFAYD